MRPFLPAVSIAVVALLAAASPSGATTVRDDTCTARLAPVRNILWRGETSRGYDPFSVSRHIEPFAVAVNHTGPACSTFLVIESRQSAHAAVLRSGASELKFNVLESTSGRDVIAADPLGSLTSRLTVPLAAGQAQRDLSFFLAIPAGQLVRGGRYDGQLTFRLYNDASAAPVLLDQTTATVTVDVPPQVLAGFGARNGPRTTEFNFGRLETGEIRSATIAVQSNMDYEVLMSSVHGGKMAHLQSGGLFTIPYATQVNGRRIGLSHAPETVLRKRFDPRQSDQYIDVAVQIGEVKANAAAGKYQDIINITIRTTN